MTWSVVRLGIRPIKQMTHTAEQIAGGDRSQRVPEAAPSSEAGQLGAALNHMLGRLDEAFDQQAASEERLRRFVADASHELRTPVTTIRGYAELYRVGGLADRDELDEAMRRTEQEAVRMARLVDDLLNLAKLDEGRPLEQRPVDLAVLAADAARDAAAVDPGRPITHRPQRRRRRARRRGPAAPGHRQHRRQRARAHAGRDGDRPARRRRRRRRPVRRHRPRPGMPPDVAARVTQRFYRADPARVRHRGGSGLGLSIADAAVVAHGGTIAVDSAVGRGTTVTVALPLRGELTGEPQGAVRSGSLDDVIPQPPPEEAPMNRKHLAAAAIAATALLGGGAGIVSAQSDDDAPPTTVADDTSPRHPGRPPTTRCTDDTVTDDTATDDTVGRRSRGRATAVAARAAARRGRCGARRRRRRGSAPDRDRLQPRLPVAELPARSGER